ncbi:MAG: cbb3-type cytochrome c oxidase N-terminal domain-containing protein [Crocinitomicaceae bacterium]
MKRLKSIKPSLGLFFALAYSSLGIAQESEIALEINRPIYEELGMSSTALFTIMLLFTVGLVLALIAIINSTKNVSGFNRNKNVTKIGLVLLAMGASSSAQAQVVLSANDALISFPDSAFWTFMIFDVILIMLMLYFIGLMRGFLTQYSPEKKPKTVLSTWNKALTNAVEIEDEDSILLDHDYDGIKELDNDLPPWWKYGFYVTIVWAVVYIAVFHVFKTAPLQEEEYSIAVAEAKLEKAQFLESDPNVVTEETVQLLTDAGVLAKGKKLFESQCKSCHKVDGGGLVGPNLTDNYWMYGSDIKGIYHTISEGANNGMAAWKATLSGEKIQAIANYILTMPEAAGGKEPQGELVEE